jgi:hypothetical protein
MAEIIKYRPAGLKLKYLPTGKIYSFDDTCEIVKYNSETFEIISRQLTIF